MGLTASFSYPFYSGGSLSLEVPFLYPIAIDGRPYLIDLKSGDFTRRSIPLLRNQADTANLPGEQSVNPEDLWRRAQETWHKGAGQDHLDRPDSDHARFNTSKGVDPWTEWKLCLLNDTAVKKATTATNLHMVVAGARWYIGYGSTLDASLHYTTTSTSADDFTAVTGTPAVAINGLTSDGVNVWAAYGASGLYHTTTALGVATQRISSSVNGPIAYVKGRLMVANDESIYNITTNNVATTSTTTLPLALKTHPNVNFRWVGFAEGANHIYAAGFAGDKSIIYRTAIVADGTILDEPIVAGQLPDGEIVRSIAGYLGFIFVGTDRGARFATSDGEGNLTFGPLVPTDAGVEGFEPQDRFMWFCWPQYDSDSVGLGRMDLSIFNEPLLPAYASDLMADVGDPVNNVPKGVVTFDDKRMFGVAGVGFYTEIGDKVASGALDTGLITYGMHDDKVALFTDVRTDELSGSYTVALAANGGTYEDLGTGTEGTATTFPAQQTKGNTFNLRLTLIRDTADATTGPCVIRLALRSYAALPAGEIFIVPILLHESIVVNDQVRYMDIQEEFQYLRSIREDRRLVLYQEGGKAHSVFLEDYEWRAHHTTEDGSYWNGTLIVKLKSLAFG